MTVRLVICEKPSVALDVARALGASERVPWGFRSDKLWVTAAAGHLLTEAPPEFYNPDWKTWTADVLPIIPETFEYVPRDSRAGKLLDVICGLIADQRVGEVVNACDAGREGELIFKLIWAHSGSDKPVRRAWFSSLTPEAIRDAFANLRPDSEMAGLEAAARRRSEADWLVGINATRAVTCALGGSSLFTVGRVQTPTLALVVRRELEIEEFTPTDYYQLSAEVVPPGRPGFVAWWRAGPDEDAADRLEKAGMFDPIVRHLKSVGRGVVDRVADEEVRRPAPRLFDLTDLQREANRRFDYTAAQTLEAAQSLYERHKLITYPRTDSRFLPSGMKDRIPGLVRSVLSYTWYRESFPGRIAEEIDPDRVVDDSKVTDHHAIIPTGVPFDPDGLGTRERAVLDLVARRFLAALLPPEAAIRRVAWVRVDGPGGPVWLRGEGRDVADPGWTSVWLDQAETDDGRRLPDVAEGEEVAVGGPEVVKRTTKPPSRHTDGSLLSAMGSAGRQASDEDVADAMKDRGLGTPATRAAIIERLLSVGYLAREGKSLRPTDKGRGLILALGDHPLTRADLTGEWERALRVIERAPAGKAEALSAKFRGLIEEFARQTVSSLVGLDRSALERHRRRIAPCPTPGCGGSVVEREKSWGCDSWRSKDDPGCGFVWWKRSSGRRRTEKQLLAYLKRLAAGEDTLPSAARVELGPCPRCGGTVVERPKSWSCDSYRGPGQPGCGYVIWKKSGGKAVSVDEARLMLKNGASNHRVAEPFGPCPRCGGTVVDRGTFLGCDSYRSRREPGCGLLVWKRREGRALSREELEAELRARAPEE